jgi:hypothetical protein
MAQIATPVKFDIGAFTDTLSLLKSGADKLNTITPSSGLIFFDGHYMFTFNGNVYCGAASPFDVVDSKGDPAQVALSYAAIMKVLKGKKGYGECIFALDGSCATFDVTGLRTESSAHVMADTSIGRLPNLPKADDTAWKSLSEPKAFKEALIITESVYDKTTVGTSLENVHMTSEYIECGTSTQFVRAQCPMPLESDVLVLGGVLSKIASSSNLTDIQINKDGSWFLLRDGTTYFAVPTSDSEYIADESLRSLFYPNDPETISLSFPDADYNKELREEIARGTAFNEKEVTITLEADKCKAVFSDVINQSRFSTSIDGVKTNCTGTVKFTIVPAVLIHILTTSGELNIHEHTVTLDTGTFAYVVTHYGLIPA